MSQDELQKIAAPLFDKFSKKELFGTTDGQVFIEEIRAKEHASRNKLTVYTLEKEESTATSEPVIAEVVAPVVPEVPTGTPEPAIAEVVAPVVPEVPTGTPEPAIVETVAPTADEESTVLAESAVNVDGTDSKSKAKGK